MAAAGRDAARRQGAVYHHDTAWLEDDTLLALATTRNTDGRIVWDGFQIQVRDLETGALTWSWSSQVAVDEGLLPVGAFGGEDTYHANAVSLVEDALGEAFYVHTATTHTLLRVDRATGEVSWRLGYDGDFTLLDASGAPIADPGAWFFFAHDPEWDPETSTLLMLDNGAGTDLRDGERYSRALELALDFDAMTATVAWEWRETDWYSPIMGDADRLPNGHVLITRATCPHCEEYGLPEPPASVVEVDPATGEVQWRATFESNRYTLYRSERVDGCALFAHAGYCPALVAR